MKRLQKTYKQHPKRLISLTLILCLLAILGVFAAFGIYRYYYPPVLRITDAEVASQVTLTTTYGDIVIETDKTALFPVAQFTRLARSGFYTGVRFHRVVPNLLVETGDPLTKDRAFQAFWGQGGLGNSFRNEIHVHDVATRGTVMFTSSGAGTYGSQFFILTKDTGWLKGKHTIIGKVTQGMEIVDRIEGTPINNLGQPSEDIIITHLTAL